MSNSKWYITEPSDEDGQHVFTWNYRFAYKTLAEVKREAAILFADEVCSSVVVFYGEDTFTLYKEKLIENVSIASESDPEKAYVVSKYENHYECNCPHSVHRCFPGQDECKHIKTAKNRETSVSLPLTVEEATYLREVLNILHDTDSYFNKVQYSIWDKLGDMEELPPSPKDLPLSRILNNA